ncbi:DUF2306 domain-containing protein [Rhodocytophaga rosea]|uniref:DUF2306 domain-containing protein n=1 Tax=Rhodocytophaga rosea TaxID=2704465 RepID=A0A6C0GTI9_9BACT|nr:DUF2306 domain-containing protein [Rhodocytophaga rosea]QHT71124.1 DUF2306 domain-containing protein [Rhodocytophaga rosea]
MEMIYTYMRLVHIVSGMTAFFVAPLALIAIKGGKNHKIWGNIFFWAMVLVAISAIPMTFYHPNLFLFLVAIFSFHLSLYGYRSVQRRRSVDLQKSMRIDFWIACIAALCYGGFIAWGIAVFFTSGSHAFGYIAIVFGLIGMRFSFRNFKAFRTPPTDTMQWWFDHMQGMVGSYIATLSAFSAVNFYFLPDTLRWLWPTLAGVPLLFFWERYYKKKMNNHGSHKSEISPETMNV